jgi:hypothetical protein
MLDVHPPHHAATTWRDFFIHIATICVGLLIAIGLEQSVEAIHHHHQRHKLEVQLHDEAQRNLELVQLNITHLRVLRKWFNSAILAINVAPVTNGRISRSTMPSQTKIDTSIWTPSRTVWAVAKASGSVALLPENEAQVYARVDFEGEQLQTGEVEMGQSTVPLGSIIKSWQGVPSAQLQFFTVAERDALLNALAQASTGVDNLLDLEFTESGACRGALNGAGSVDDIFHYIQNEAKQPAVQ